MTITDRLLSLYCQPLTLSDVTSHVAWVASQKGNVQLLLKPQPMLTRAKHAITSGNAVGISNSFCYLTLNSFHRRRLTCGKVRHKLPWQNLGGAWARLGGTCAPWSQRRTATGYFADCLSFRRVFTTVYTGNGRTDVGSKSPSTCWNIPAGINLSLLYLLCYLLVAIWYLVLKKTNHNCQTVYIVYCLGYYYRYYYLTIPQREEGGVDGPQMFTHHNTWVARLSSG